MLQLAISTQFTLCKQWKGKKITKPEQEKSLFQTLLQHCPLAATEYSLFLLPGKRRTYSL